MKLVSELKQSGAVTMYNPKKGIYFTIKEEPSSYEVSGFIDDEPINLSLISESELWEFAKSV